jgi:hypothetical protein
MLGSSARRAIGRVPDVRGPPYLKVTWELVGLP